MYEDKTLVCKECGKEFVFTAGEQEFYAERGFQNRSAARAAATHARTLLAVRVSSLLQPVLPVAARLAFRLSRSLTVRFIAASALQKCASSNIVTLKEQ